jgi:WhiB family transcriptional regulator, redox-sensing transcriptional regulator
VDIASSAVLQSTGSNDHAWRSDAACLDEDPELFFPEGESERYQRQIEAALEVCAACPVSAECLDYALDADQRTGIWGGTTAEHRRRIRLGAAGVASARRPRPVATTAPGPRVLAGHDHLAVADLDRAAG